MLRLGTYAMHEVLAPRGLLTVDAVPAEKGEQPLLLTQRSSGPLVMMVRTCVGQVDAGAQAAGQAQRGGEWLRLVFRLSASTMEQDYAGCSRRCWARAPGRRRTRRCAGGFTSCCSLRRGAGRGWRSPTTCASRRRAGEGRLGWLMGGFPWALPGPYSTYLSLLLASSSPIQPLVHEFHRPRPPLQPVRLPQHVDGERSPCLLHTRLCRSPARRSAVMQKL